MTGTLDDLTRRVALDRVQARLEARLLELLKRDQDIRFAPFTMLLTGAGAAAALIGATAAALGLALHWLGKL